MGSNATQTSLEASTGFAQSYVVFNNSVPGFAYANVSFFVDGDFYANATANASGFVSFNYTGVWSSHIFEWVTDNMRYDVNHDGVVDEDGVVNLLDMMLVSLHMGVVQ